MSKQFNKIIIKSYGENIFEEGFEDFDDLKEIKLPKKLRFKF